MVRRGMPFQKLEMCIRDSVRVNGAHQFAQFGGDLIFPLYIFFVFPLEILIQPVLDGYPAAGKVALVPVSYTHLDVYKRQYSYRFLRSSDQGG